MNQKNEPDYQDILDRIFPDPSDLRVHLDRTRPGARIVLTNGCFDLIHRGHITYLSRARALGDLLVVALNSDESVRKLKGSTRPVNPLEDRLFQMAALRMVDFVTSFPQDTPIETIRIIRPTIHVKGGDYKPEDLPEKPVVEEGGGRVEILSFVDGYSTTSLIKKMNSGKIP